MKRKIVFAMVLILLLSLVGCGRKNDGIVREKWSHTYDGYPVVYISPEVSTEGLVSVLRALEVPDGENAAIKLSNTETDDLDGKIIYVNVMDRLSIESSGITLPASNSYNIGILASYDPVALDQACVDLIYILQEGKTFAEQIEACNGIQMLVYAEAIGLGSRTYAFSSIES